ncbi:MAG: M3 family metallopeptidase [Bacteroidaceae bacterium]|nr:M3 family metallopeptidase [Bacteroidaceae bacterium]
MKLKPFFLLIVICCMNYACVHKTEQNPFFSEFSTKFGAPPFDKIKFEDYEPAFMKGFEQQNEEINAIVNAKEEPTFQNTIEALDNSGEILNRVGGVFNSITEALTNDSIAALSMKLAPIMAEHSDNMYLNVALFKKVEKVHQKIAANEKDYTSEQKRLTDTYYRNFIRSGAALDSEKQEKLRAINKELSTLGIQFSKHVLNDNNSYQLVIDNEKDLSGLPEWFKKSAAEEAKAKGMEGKWLFTIDTASRLPFLQYADNRALRKEVYTAYTNKGNHNDENDNKKIITRILQLRLEKANLLGFKTAADFILDVTMAKSTKTVMDFLQNIWTVALDKAKVERANMQKLMDREHKGEKLQAWDWWYYTNKVKQETFNFNEDVLKPYFKLEDVRAGAFMVANKLYGVTFTKLTDIPVYHKDVEVFEVKDKDGNHLALFYTDYFPRASKRGGAWMSNFREEKAGVRPLVYNVGNFTKPSGDTPSLLTLDEVETTFHEFGHALHGMLTKCNYQGTSGTNVARDFVELPSQVMENWSTYPEVLKLYAKNYKTGETIPDALIQKIQEIKTFNQGFVTTELTAAALLDMKLHSLTNFDNFDPLKFEKEEMQKLGLIPEIAPRYRVTYFNHIIGGYAAGYYSYLWANVLDADAFESFKKNGTFDKKTADLFRTNILEKGNSEDPMKLYIQFKGAQPKVDAMLQNRGLK